MGIKITKCRKIQSHPIFTDFMKKGVVENELLFFQSRSVRRRLHMFGRLLRNRIVSYRFYLLFGNEREKMS